MKQSILNTAVQGFILFVLMFSIASISEADELTSALESHFDESSYRFLDYESINQAHADEYGSMRYLVMDFDLALASADLQSNIHNICSRVLKDQHLLRQLSDAGYDMVSVSFDRQSQYDCL